jgi:transposase
VSSVALRIRALTGVGVETAAQLLVTTGANAERLRSEASFASLCAASPIPASSGKTNRHQLNPAGDRAANKALYIITIVRLRDCPKTRVHVHRRQAEGLRKREAIRCVKRYVAREAYHAIRADLTAA